mmetsp:Transcript_27391/g.46286  ORF Transcript_27391/g.46286 Transcript_27391/m.46286 type:complete len:2248 (+) Transcript_27391:148-6891(+)
MYNVRVSSTRKQYNNFHVSTEQNIERELQIKSELLDGTQESFTATVSKLSMIEQELEMLKIDQFGKIDSVQNKQSSVSNLYPSKQSEQNYHDHHDRDQNARDFLTRVAASSSTSGAGFSTVHASPANDLFLQPSLSSEPVTSPEYTHNVNFYGKSQSQFNLTPPVDPFDSLLSKSAGFSQQTFAQQQQQHELYSGHESVVADQGYNTHSLGNTPQTPHQQAEDLLQKFQKLTSMAHAQYQSPSHTQSQSQSQFQSPPGRCSTNQGPPGSVPPTDMGQGVPENVNDAEVAVMQSELARTCKRENAMQEEHRQACLALQESWEKLSRLRKHIAEFRGAIEETTIEDIHHQTNQWQLNAYRENHAPSPAHMMKYYNTCANAGRNLGGGASQQLVVRSQENQQHSRMRSQRTKEKNMGDDKLTSMLLGFDDDGDEEGDNGCGDGKEGRDTLSKEELKEMPYIDYPQQLPPVVEKDDDEEARISAESARIIHLQVLREKVRMRDALRGDLQALEEKLNSTRRELDEASNMLISTSQVAKEQPRGSMVGVSKGIRDKVTTLSTTLSDAEVSYVNLTQQQLTIETEVRTSLEQLHINEQEQLQKQQRAGVTSNALIQSGQQPDLTLLTENDCDRLIRESQSAMAAKNGIFTWSTNPNKTPQKKQQTERAASAAVYQLEQGNNRSTGLGGATNLTLDEILQGRAKLTRMNGEKAGAYRSRLQKRLAGMLVILGQLQAEVDEKTLAVKVARERMRECEVKRLRLELQMAHVGAILQKRRENAMQMEAAYDHGADIPDVLLDGGGGSGGGSGQRRQRSQRSYHKSKSQSSQKHRRSSPGAGVSHHATPTADRDYSTPNGSSRPFHISELESSEEHKASPQSNGKSVARRLEEDTPPSRPLTKDEEMRINTKKIMSLAGNLLSSEYAKCSSVVVDDENSEEGDVDDKKGNNDDDADSSGEQSGRLSPLERVIREKSGELKSKKSEKSKSKAMATNDRNNLDKTKKNLKVTPLDTNDSAPASGLVSPPKSPSGLRGRFAALSSGFVPRPVLDRPAAASKSNDTHTHDDIDKVDPNDLANDEQLPEPNTQADGEEAIVVQADKEKNNKMEKTESPKRQSFVVEYDRDGRKLYRTKSGELIPSRSQRKPVLSGRNKKAPTGRYSIDAQTKRSAKGLEPSGKISAVEGGRPAGDEGSRNGKKPELTKSHSFESNPHSRSPVKTQPNTPAVALPSAASSVTDGDTQVTSSLNLLMDHLQSVADSVVEEAERLDERRACAAATRDHSNVRTPASVTRRGVRETSHETKDVDFSDSAITEETEEGHASTKKIMWQEAMINELLMIILNQTDTPPVANTKTPEADGGKSKRRVRSNSMDSHCTDVDLVPPTVTTHPSGEKNKMHKLPHNQTQSDQETSGHAPDARDEQIQKYQSLLVGINSQELIDLLYAQQKELKIAQMENEVHKLELQAAAHRLKVEKSAAAATEHLFDKESTGSVSKKRSSSMLTSSSAGSDDDNHGVVRDDIENGVVRDDQNQDHIGNAMGYDDFVAHVDGELDVDRELELELQSAEQTYNSYTDQYMAESEKRLQNIETEDVQSEGREAQHLSPVENLANSLEVVNIATEEPQHQARDQVEEQQSGTETEGYSRVAREKERAKKHGPVSRTSNDSLPSRNSNLPQSHTNSHQPSVASTNSKPTSTPISTSATQATNPADNVFTSAYSSEQLDIFLANAMSIDVQEKHQQLSTERTELPIPPPKEFNVYSRRMSELDSLKLQLDKWTDKLNALHAKDAVPMSPAHSVPNARLDMTVITARYLPEMKKVSSLLQSSLYAEMTVESINPYGFEESMDMWRATVGQSRMGSGGCDDDSDTTISDISDGESVEKEDSALNPERVLSLVRQRTLTQWNMKLPDWRTDPLSISFPCHKPRRRHGIGHGDRRSVSTSKTEELYLKYLLSSYVVYVTIWSASRSGLDELVARGALPLTALADQKKHSFWLQLRYPSDVYQAVRSRSKIPDGCSVRVDARLMHSKKLFYMAKISETQAKINVLARRHPQSVPAFVPPPQTAGGLGRETARARARSRAMSNISATASQSGASYAELHPVKKVAPYVPVQRTRLNTSDTFNTKHSLTSNTLNSSKASSRRQNSKSPQKSSIREAGPVTSPPQKKQRSSSDLSSGMFSETDTDSADHLPLTKESLATVGENANSSKPPPPPAPNLSIFKGAGVRMREQSARQALKKSSQAARKGFGSGVEKEASPSTFSPRRRK